MTRNNGTAKGYAEGLIAQDFDPKKLERSGRLQFFYHSPSSNLPVRDVCDEQGHGHKTEPHLEENAENFKSECYQKLNIQGLLKCHEEYLFLFTTCKSRAPHMEKYHGERFIVGYIRVARFLPRQGFIAVQGDTTIVSFEDAYPLEDLVGPEKVSHTRLGRLSIDETAQVLNRLNGKKNIKNKCIKEIERLETGLRTKEIRRCS